MDILTLFIEYFGIDLLNETSTLSDLFNVSIEIFIGIFLVCFCVRSLFLLVRFGR